MNKMNQKFSGTLNGKEYNDLDEFLRDYQSTLLELDKTIEASANLNITSPSEDKQTPSSSEKKETENTKSVDLSSLYKVLPVFGELLEKTGLELGDISNDSLIATYEHSKQDPIKEIQKILDDRGNLAAPTQIEEELDKLDPESLDKLNSASSRIVSALSENRASLSSQLDELTDELEKTNALLTFYKDTMKTCESNKKHYNEYKKLRSSVQRSDELLDGIFDLISKTMGLTPNI